jgi:hypothetical protein
MAVGEADLDHRGGRRLGRVEGVIWYLVAAFSYIGLGIFHKFLLNWFVGPLWLVGVVVVGPVVTDALRHGGRLRR